MPRRYYGSALSDRICAFLALAGLVAIPIASGSQVFAGTADSAVGRSVPSVTLTDGSGAEVTIDDFRDARFLVVVFLGTGCPIGNQYIPILNELAERYRGRGVQVLGVNANSGESNDEVAAHAREYDIQFPMLKDATFQLSRAIGVTRMAEAFVLDARRVVRYQGRIDDRFGYTVKRTEPTRNDLREALDDLLNDRAVRVDHTDVAGCLINVPEIDLGTPSVTYAGQVAAIIQNKCQNCHHEGTAAPFSLGSHEEAVNWAAMIREVVTERRMPPWFADPRYGHFDNDSRLTEQEIEILRAWVDQGCELGDPALLPPPKKYPVGWTIGEPDVVFEMPEEFTVPASGVVPYQYFETATNFEEDVYIQAAEAVPGNRAATHHIIAFMKSGGDSPQVDELRQEWIVGTAPGDMPLVLPPGVALKIPARTKIIWQMHYTPTGKVEKDRSKIGLVLYKQSDPPTHLVKKVPIVDRDFVRGRNPIPPGARHHEVRANFTFEKNSLLLGFMPHMHLRGKDFQYVAEYPDGTSEILLSVPRYNFNWQSAYRFATPHRVPAGTTLRCVAHFDNSRDNPAEIDTTQEVRWGEQTWEEMMIGYTDFIHEEPESIAFQPLKLSGK